MARITASRGAVVLGSTEFDVLAHLCGRVMVFLDGGAVAQLTKPGPSETRILEHCFSCTTDAIAEPAA